MNKLLEFIKKDISTVYIVFIILSPFVMYLTKSFLSFMLGFNIFLAYIPLLIIWYLNNYEKKNVKFYILLVIFIFFLPNTFYVITDMIHINSSVFYTFNDLYTPMTYLRNISAYIMLIHISLTVILGIYAGIVSLTQFKKILSSYKLNNIKINIIIITTILLSSIGIYIGRFLRFFSWDIINPIKVITEFIQSIDYFAIEFILIFTITQIILYYIGNKFIKKELI